MRITYALLLFAPIAAAQTPWRQDHRRVDVADGIATYVAAESPGGVVQGNVTVISGKDRALVVDTGQFPSLARKIVADLQQRGTNVAYVVNTHYHGDHMLANHVFEAAWPALQVIQHTETLRLGQKSYADWSGAGVKQTADFLVAVEKMLADGKTTSGKPLTDDQRYALSTDLMLAKQWMEESADTRWVPPDIAFAQQVDVDLGGRSVSIRHVGLGNTPGDAVVWDEQTKTLVAGDVVVHPTPYAYGSFLTEWIATLDALRALQPARIVPGHGEVMEDDRYLQRLQALFGATRDRVHAANDAGKTLEQVQKEITLADFERELAGENRDRIRAFREHYLQPAIVQAWKEVRGESRAE